MSGLLKKSGSGNCGGGLGDADGGDAAVAVSEGAAPNAVIAANPAAAQAVRRRRLAGNEDMAGLLG
jgi:hypothetical protein